MLMLSIFRHFSLMKARRSNDWESLNSMTPLLRRCKGVRLTRLLCCAAFDQVAVFIHQPLARLLQLFQRR